MRKLRQVKCFAIIVSWSRHHTKIGEEHFRLLGTNGSHAKLRIKDLLLRARVFVRTSNMKIPRRRLADFVKKIAP